MGNACQSRCHQVAAEVAIFQHSIETKRQRSRKFSQRPDRANNLAVVSLNSADFARTHHSLAKVFASYERHSKRTFNDPPSPSHVIARASSLSLFPPRARARTRYTPIGPRALRSLAIYFETQDAQFHAPRRNSSRASPSPQCIFHSARVFRTGRASVLTNIRSRARIELVPSLSPAASSVSSVSLSFSVCRQLRAVSSAVPRSQWWITRECGWDTRQERDRDVFENYQQPSGEPGTRTGRVPGLHRASPSQWVVAHSSRSTGLKCSEADWA